MGLFETLTVVFIILKLCHIISWGWWKVWSPMWLGYGILFGVLLVGGVIYCVFMLVLELIRSKK